MQEKNSTPGTTPQGDTPAISILIPVYNVEAYLSRCLDSILQQTYTHWECILINDGSLDSSGQICDEYAKRDPRIRVIHQENSGVAVVRNRLIEEAQGEWLAFVDGDDWVEPHYLQALISLQQQTQADIVSYGHIKHFATFTRESCETFSGTGSEACLLTIQDSLTHFLWSRLISRQLLQDNNIRCVPHQDGAEDLVLLCLATYYAKKVVCAPDIIYHYNRYHMQSYCSHSSPTFIRNICANYLSLIQYFNEQQTNTADDGTAPSSQFLELSVMPALWKAYALYCSNNLLLGALVGHHDFAMEMRSRIKELPANVIARLPRSHRLALHIRSQRLLHLYARIHSRLTSKSN